MSGKPPPQARELLHQAKQLGFRFIETTGSGHLRLRHDDTGAEYIAPATGSDWRGNRNAISEMERLSGRKLVRPNAAHYRHTNRQPNNLTRRTDKEEAASRRARHLEAKAAELQQLWDEAITSAPPISRAAAATARKVMQEYEEIRASLAKMHRVIPPLR